MVSAVTGAAQQGSQRALANFVGGQYVPALDGRTSDVIDPSTGEAYLQAPVSGPADVDAALRTAAAAFETWRDSTPAERSLALLKFADAIEARTEDLVEAESRNTGKPVALTRADEVPPLADELRFFAGAARILEGKSAGEYLRGHTSMIRREPVGVCAQVAPWNYPMMMAVWKFAPALAAGNTVVLKPSDTTPVSTLLLAEIAAEFFPPGVFNVICGDRDTGRALVSHEIPQMVSITGLGPRWHRGRPGGSRRAEARAPGAWRQGAGRRLRRRRHRAGSPADHRRRLLQRRAGLHGGHPGAGRTRHQRGPDRRAGRAGRHGQDRRPRGRRSLLRAAEQPRAARPGRRASWSAPRSTPRSRPAGTGSASGASASPRRS